MPIIVVIPGVAAVVLAPDLNRPDEAFPEMMKLVPSGLLGIVFAALIAAIASSLSSMTNSISTIFVLDIYKPILNTKASEKNLVITGRIVSVISMFVAVVLAVPLLGKFDQAFQYIQEFTGFFTPGIVVIFMLGIFWNKTTSNAALIAAISSEVLYLLMKIYWPTLPFMDRVGVVFICCIAIAVIVSLLENKNTTSDLSSTINGQLCVTTKGYNIVSLGVIAVLTGLYSTWW